MIDPRLICNGCGEVGRIVSRPDPISGAKTFAVSCSGRSQKGICCQTHFCETEQKATEKWESLHEDMVRAL